MFTVGSRRTNVASISASRPCTRAASASSSTPCSTCERSTRGASRGCASARSLPTRFRCDDRPPLAEAKRWRVAAFGGEPRFFSTFASRHSDTATQRHPHHHHRANSTTTRARRRAGVTSLTKPLSRSSRRSTARPRSSRSCSRKDMPSKDKASEAQRGNRRGAPPGARTTPVGRARRRRVERRRRRRDGARAALRQREDRAQVAAARQAQGNCHNETEPPPATHLLIQ